MYVCSDKFMSFAYSAVGTEREHYMHARYECIMIRYPYFWMGLIHVAEEEKRRLTDKHRAHMMHMFGISI